MNRKVNKKSILDDLELKNNLREIEHPIIGKIINKILKFRILQRIVAFFSGDYIFNEKIFEKQKTEIDKYYSEHNFSYTQLIKKKYSIEKKKNRKNSVTLPIIISLVVTLMCNFFVSNVADFCYNIISEWCDACVGYIIKLQKIPFSNDVFRLYMDIIKISILLIISMIACTMLIYLIFKLLSYVIDGFKLRKYTINEYILRVLDNKINEIENNHVDIVGENKTDIKHNITREANLVNIVDEEIRYYTITIKEKNK